MSKITFEDKQIAVNPAAPEAPLEVLSASDINEIKQSVNYLYDNPIFSGSTTGSTDNFIQSDSYETGIQQISSRYNNIADLGEGTTVTQEVTPEAINLKINLTGEGIVDRELILSNYGVLKSTNDTGGEIQIFERARIFNNDYSEGIQSLKQEYKNDNGDNKSLSVALNFNTDNIDDLGDNDVIDCELFLPRDNGELITKEKVDAKIIIDEDLTTTQTSSTLNTKYSNALIKQTVIAPNVATGMSYIKVDSVTWISFQGTLI